MLFIFKIEAQFIGKMQYGRQVEAQNRSKNCSQLNSRYAVDGQCDKYIQCDNGISSEKLCPDGLLFAENASIYSYPCKYPNEVNCSTRTRTQAPQVFKIIQFKFITFILSYCAINKIRLEFYAVIILILH